MMLNAFVFPMLMTPRVTQASHDVFRQMLEEDKISVVALQADGSSLYFQAADDSGAQRIYSTGVFPDAELQQRLSESGVQYPAVIPQENSSLMNFLLTWIFPTLIMVLPMVLLWRAMQKRLGDGNMMSFGMGRSNAKMYVAAQTGKTLLAKAVAGEANVPFFSIAPSAETAAKVDEEVVSIIRTAHEKALGILRENRDKLHELAKFLQEKETITGDEFMSILNGTSDASEIS